jgi:hypothetical protein
MRGSGCQPRDHLDCGLEDEVSIKRTLLEAKMATVLCHGCAGTSSHFEHKAAASWATRALISPAVHARPIAASTKGGRLSAGSGTTVLARFAVKQKSPIVSSSGRGDGRVGRKAGAVKIMVIDQSVDNGSKRFATIRITSNMAQVLRDAVLCVPRDWDPLRGCVDAMVEEGNLRD